MLRFVAVPHKQRITVDGTAGVMRPQEKVWVLTAKRMARRICDLCFTCRYLTKRCREQLMVALPSHRMGPAPLIDLTVVICLSQSTFWIQTTSARRGRAGESSSSACDSSGICRDESYSTDSFLMALRRFKAKNGAPRRFQSNQGDQLVAADCAMGLVRGG
jgi:hypothetical protein